MTTDTLAPPPAGATDEELVAWHRDLVARKAEAFQKLLADAKAAHHAMTGWWGVDEAGWIAACQEARLDPDNHRGLPTHRRDGLVDDAALLQHVLDPAPEAVTIGELPLEYSSIFDNILVERPVVLQHQASRRLRHNPGTDHR